MNSPSAAEAYGTSIQNQAPSSSHNTLLGSISAGEILGGLLYRQENLKALPTDNSAKHNVISPA